jgi:hypothetical protein
MRIIRNPDITATVESRVPPGAYIAKFYRHGPLATGPSGDDHHPLGAEMIRINAHAKIPSTGGDIVIGVFKNDQKFAELTILQGEPTAELDLVGLDLVATFAFVTVAPSLYFRPLLDAIHTDVISAGSGAENLTISCIFDR